MKDKEEEDAKSNESVHTAESDQEDADQV